MDNSSREEELLAEIERLKKIILSLRKRLEKQEEYNQKFSRLEYDHLPWHEDDRS
jgi:hypothetical protein